MNLEKTITEELKKAIKLGSKLRMETLRSLRATIIEFNKSGIGREMNDDDELKILQSAAKQRRDAIELYEKAGRTELSDKEKAELVIITELSVFGSAQKFFQFFFLQVERGVFVLI